MKNNLFLTITILSVIFTGCSIYQITSEETTLDYYPSKSSIEEVSFLEQIDRPHEIIGTVYVNTERRQSFDEVIDKMKREAAILGGDAITELKTDATGTWKRIARVDFLNNAYVRAQYSAKVVVFK